MAHMFRKYTSNRGSALFMVISTMTALIVSCMAMYFSMVSARSSQFAVFNQIQASQSAQSIADIVFNSITDPANHDAGGGLLLQQMKTLEVGESITTDANGFKSFDPSVATGLDEDQLGAYSVTITRMPNYPNGNKRFDIMVLSSVGGNRDAVHLDLGYNENEQRIPGSDGDSGGDSELFAATGYVSNDAYLDGGIFLTNTFFDTEFTFSGMFDNKTNYLAGNIATGGSFIMKSYLKSIANHTEAFSPLARPTVWAIRGDFEIDANNPLQFCDKSKVLVGKDMTFLKDGGFEIGNSGTVDIYILGDLNIDKSANFSSINLHVNGDINIASGQWPSFNNVYINGSINCDHAVTINGTQAAWTDTDNAGLTKNDVIDELERRTNTKEYYKWKISDSEVDKDNPIHIRLNSDNKPHNGVPGWSNTFYIAYPNSTSAKDSSIDSSQRVIGKGFTIDGFDGFINNNDIPLSIIIDTGDNEDNIVTLRVNPYRDINNDGVPETFSWVPNSPSKFGVIVKGRGSVIIDIPDGCTYQDVDRAQTMHYSWFRLLGGQEGERTGSVDTGSGWVSKTVKYYDVSPISGGTLVPALNGGGQIKPSLLTAQLIHTDCVKGDGCDYTFEAGTDKCPVCNAAYTEIVCSKHGKVDFYCASCNQPKQSKVDKWKDASNSERAEGFCANRLDKGKVDQYLAANPDIKTAISDANGVIYPHVNIYLETCSESTDIRFSTAINGTSIIENGFYGYIYAPYITYKGEGNSGTLCARFCGGLIVSDYVFNDNYPVIACYPEKMPNELAKLDGGGSMAGGKLGGTIKSWKIDIGGYR